MKTRVLTGLVAFLILIPFVVFSDTWFFTAGVALCAVISLWEALHCVGLHKNFWLLIPYGLVAAGTPFAIRYLGTEPTLTMVAPALFILMLYTYAVCVFGRGKVNVADACGGFVTALYAIGGFSALVYLHDFHEGGRFLYLLAFIGAWVTDIFAYFSGRLFGKHKLIPEISPKKTVEGSIGGMLFSVLAFLGFTFVYNTWLVGLLFNGEAVKMQLTLSYPLMAAVGLIVSVVSQIGDLSMSALKRYYGIKDFGKIFPGHGGMLDRMDSILFMCLVLFCYRMMTVL